MFVSAALLTIFSYLQSIGAAFSFPDIGLPSALVDTFSAFSNFLSTVQKIVTSIPQYDIRFQLCVMIFIIPLLLNLFLDWIAFPVHRIVFCLLDVVGAFISLLFLALIILNKFKPVYIVFFIVGIGYLIGRTIFFFVRRKKNEIKVPVVCQNICNHFLYGFVPRLKLSMTLNHINRAIHRYAVVTEIRPTHLNPFTEILLMVGAALLIAFSIWCCDGFHLVVELPAIVRCLFPWVGFPFGIYFFILFFVRLFKRGREFIFNCKLFILKWGQITILMALTCLYIPVLLSTANHFMSSKTLACPAGQYRKPIPSRNNSLDYLLYTESFCSPCNLASPNLSSNCQKLCSSDLSYLYQQPSYEFTENVIKISGALMVFGIIGFLISIPLAWFFLIFFVRKFLKNVNAFGKDSEDKWQRLMERMTSSGVILIRPFKYKHAFWPIIHFVIRAFVVVFTVCLARISEFMVVVPMVLYVILIVLDLVFKPYIRKTNLFFDVIMLGCCILFTIFPVIGATGASLPSVLAAPLFIIAFLIPIVIFIIFYIKREKFDFEDDPTYPKTVPRDVEEVYEKHRQAAMEERHNKEKSGLTSDANFGATSSMYPQHTYRRHGNGRSRRSRRPRDYSYSYSYSYSTAPDTGIRSRTGNRHRKTPRGPAPNPQQNPNDYQSIPINSQPNDRFPQTNVQNPANSQLIAQIPNEAALNNRDVGNGASAALPWDFDYSDSDIEPLKSELELRNVDVGEGKGGKDQPPIQETNPAQDGQGQYDYYSDGYGYYSDGYYPYDDEYYPYYDDYYDYYDYYSDDDRRPPNGDPKAPLLPPKKGKKKKKKKKKQKPATPEGFTKENVKQFKKKKGGRPEKTIIKYDSNGKRYIIHRRMYTFLRERFDEGEDEFIEQEKFERLKRHNKEELYCWIEEDCYKLHTGDLSTIADAIKQEQIGKVAPGEQPKIKAYTINFRLLGRRIKAMYEMLDIIIHGATVEWLTRFNHIFLLLASAAAGWYVGALFAYDIKFDRIPICG